MHSCERRGDIPPSMIRSFSSRSPRGRGLCKCRCQDSGADCGRRSGHLKTIGPQFFFFGGSTTFGYNVRDEETLASHFQDLSEAAFSREVQVYNFGRGNYASSAEMLLFLRLLFEGHRPEVAVFVDGLNDFQHGGSRDLLQSNDLRRLYDNYDSNDLADQLPQIVAALPIMKAINWLMTTLGLHHPDTGVPAPASDSRPAEERSRTIKCGCDVGALWAEPPNSPGAFQRNSALKLPSSGNPFHSISTTWPIIRFAILYRSGVRRGMYPATAKSKHCTRHKAWVPISYGVPVYRTG